MPAIKLAALFSGVRPRNLLGRKADVCGRALVVVDRAQPRVQLGHALFNIHSTTSIAADVCDVRPSVARAASERNNAKEQHKKRAGLHALNHTTLTPPAKLNAASGVETPQWETH